LLVLLTGCNKTPVELAGIKRVAVLTLDNLTSRQELGAEIKQELMAQIPRSLAVEVVDGAAIEAGLPPNGIEAALSQPGRAAELGRRFGVDAFVVGMATTYREERDSRLNMEWSSQEGFDASMSLEIGVSLGFNLRLLRAADGSSVIYRQAADTRTEVLVFGLVHPFISFTISAQPHYQQLREEAIHQAVHELIRGIRREYGGK